MQGLKTSATQNFQENTKGCQTLRPGKIPKKWYFGPTDMIQ